MQNFIRTLIAFLIINNYYSVINAQAPAMNYQAVARDVNGAILVNQPIGLQFSITNGSGGPVLYSETQTTSTNQFGIFATAIGYGTVTFGNFSAISWGVIDAWLKVEMDATGGTNYVNMGSSQLLSVPYALNAGNNFWSLAGANLHNITSGNVGIGTAAPTLGKLQVQGSAGATVAYFSDSVNSPGLSFVSDWPAIYFNSYYNSGIKAMSSSGYPSLINTDQNLGGITFSTTDSSNTLAGADVGANLRERLRIAGNGNIGIGNNNPINILDVAGSTTIVGNFVNTSTGANFKGVYGSCSITPGSGSGVVGQGGLEGVVGFAIFGGAGDRFGLQGDAENGTGSNFGASGTAVGGLNAYGVYGNASAGTNNWAGFFSGSVFTTGTYVTSDRKFKNDIQPLSGALEIINRLNPSVYTFNTNKYKQMHLPEGLQYGLIADEVQQILPSAVKHAVQPAEYDLHKANKLSDEVEFNAVNYTEMIPILIGAVKELKLQNEELKREIEELKKK